MKKLKLLLTFIPLFALTACGINKNSGNNSGKDDEQQQEGGDQGGEQGGEETPEMPIIDGALVTVNFYPDFNHNSKDDILMTIQSANGQLISQHPADLTTPNFSEFPTFVGWSDKPVVINKLYEKY